METHRQTEESSRRERLNRFGILLIALASVSFAFRLLAGIGLQHASLLFIGLPALLAWIVASSTPPKTAFGSVMRATTLALLISWIFLGEAFICVLMASPLFYLVGAIIGLIRGKGESQARLGITVVLLLPFSLEGVTPELSARRERQVVVEATVDASVEQVRDVLAATPRFDRELPLFFRLGFPAPRDPQGDGLDIGDERSILFSHGSHHDGRLVMRVIGTDPEWIRFEAVADDSYLTHWLTWRDATVSMTQDPTGGTRVRWTVRYARRLDPSWYFDPLEKYGVTLAARYLLATLTTPPGASSY